MKRLQIGLLALTLALSGLAVGQQSDLSNQSSSANHAQDVANIEQVMAAFHMAVVAHNGQGVAALFVPEGSTWFNVLSDKAFAAAQVKNPAAVKVRHSTFADFAKFVSSTSSALNPQHTHVQIHTDGTIAAVYFHYDFLIDGKTQNQGSETWQLVKAADGWKIASITYSSNPNA